MRMRLMDINRQCEGKLIFFFFHLIHLSSKSVTYI
jgi:hypothetical protein